MKPLKSGTVVQYVYEVEQGKARCYYCDTHEVNYIDDEKFHKKDFHDPNREFPLNKWSYIHIGSNSYSYHIYIDKNDDIKNYILDVKHIIAKLIKEKINELTKSLEAIDMFNKMV